MAPVLPPAPLMPVAHPHGEIGSAKVQIGSKPIQVVLLVEDNPGDARLLREMFIEQGSHRTEFHHAQSMREAETFLSERTVDIIHTGRSVP